MKSGTLSLGAAARSAHQSKHNQTPSKAAFRVEKEKIAVSATISEKEISYTLTAKHSDTLSFTHPAGQEISVRILPRTRPDGKLTVYEKWGRVGVGRSYRLLTERGHEIVFELPFLFEYHLEQAGYPSEAEDLIERFFKNMVGSVFHHYPKGLFK